MPPTIKRFLSCFFFAGIVFLGARTCEVESADCEIVFRLEGAAIPDLQEMEILLYDLEENEIPIGEFKKYYPRGGDGEIGRWPLVISAGKYRVETRLHTKTNDIHFNGSIELEDGQSVSFYIPSQSP